MRRDLCESAKKGKLCIDDLCRGVGETLCGFDPELYAEMVEDDVRPEETEPHFHPCSKCSEPYECWCDFPEVHPQDDMARCPECQAKQ